MEYSRAGGKLIHEKNQKQKISWHCPFKEFDIVFPRQKVSGAKGPASPTIQGRPQMFLLKV
jgi:hypothetical protein